MTGTLAAWQAGRDHRRGTLELLSSTGRSTLARLSAMTIAITVAAVAGTAVAWLSAAITVWRTATFFSTDAIWLLLSVVPYVFLAATIGTLFGHLVRLRIIAPLVGAGLYLVFAIPAYTSSPLRVLNSIEWIDDECWMLDPLLLVSICVFAIGAALVTLGVASIEQRPASYQIGWASAAIGLIIVVISVPAAAVHFPNDAGPPTPNEAARHLICTADEGPKVCVYAPDAAALDDITESARRDLGRLEGLEGAPTWAAP